MNQEFEELTLNQIGTLTKGCIFSLKSEHGRYKFSKYVKTEDGKDWIECWGGISGHNQFRAVNPDRVRKIEKRAS